MEAAIHEKEGLNCFITAGGDLCVDHLIPQQQELFVTCWVLDIMEERLATITVTVSDHFGCNRFHAVERKRTSPNVDTTAGVLVTVITIVHELCRAWAIIQLHCLEAEVHVKDVLKYTVATIPGEPCVMMDSMTQQ